MSGGRFATPFRRASLSDLLAAVYLICFALIAGGAFALMSQNLRSSAPLARSPRATSQLATSQLATSQLATSQKSGSSPRRHLEAPEPGDEVLCVDLSRERLEELDQQAL
jgi:hypothetical protein